jgi:pimeloyl-ACP methyl ester carboxylesterase
MDIFCIPGFGVDHRVFKYLSLPGHQLHYISWITPGLGDTMEDYARRLSSQIDTSKPYALLGFSMGGMVASEMARFLKPEKLILISTAKGSREIPLFLKALRFFPVHLYAPEFIYEKAAWLFRRRYGIEKKDDQLFYEMIHSMPPYFRKRSADFIINWKNNPVYPCLHIQGTKDVIIPHRNVKEAILIKGGRHFMLMNQPSEISDLILNYLNTQQAT